MVEWGSKSECFSVRGSSFTRDSKEYAKQGSRTGLVSIGAPLLGNMEAGAN